MIGGPCFDSSVAILRQPEPTIIQDTWREARKSVKRTGISDPQPNRAALEMDVHAGWWMIVGKNEHGGTGDVGDPGRDMGQWLHCVKQALPPTMHLGSCQEVNANLRARLVRSSYDVVQTIYSTGTFGTADERRPTQI